MSAENPLGEYLGPFGGAISAENRPRPGKGDLPTEKCAIQFERLEVHGHSVGVADAWQAPAGMSVEAGPGAYVLEADCVAYASERRVARVRAVRDGCNPGRRTPIGEIPVDVGMACIYDGQLLGD